jgi:hypothetical protein
MRRSFGRAAEGIDAALRSDGNGENGGETGRIFRHPWFGRKLFRRKGLRRIGAINSPASHVFALFGDKFGPSSSQRIAARDCAASSFEQRLKQFWPD